MLDEADLPLGLGDDPLADQPWIDDSIDPARAEPRMTPPPGDAAQHEAGENGEGEQGSAHGYLLRRSSVAALECKSKCRRHRSEVAARPEVRPSVVAAPASVRRWWRSRPRRPDGRC